MSKQAQMSALQAQMDRSIDNIRRCAEEMLELAELRPAQVVPVLAEVPDRVWRAMMLALRYPDDNDRVGRLV